MTQGIVLASASPRRTELLSQIGISHRVFSVDINESSLPQETPFDLVRRLAKQKACAVQQQLKTSQDIILAADTIIDFQGGALGKPQNEEECIQTLLLLSDHCHQVRTSFCIMRDDQEYCETVTSTIQFGSISKTEAQTYWQTGEPADKAGSYAIQGRGAVFVKSIKGSYSAVVGLPLFECRRALLQFGVGQ